MKHGWLEPSRKKAKMAVGIFYLPDGFDGSLFRKPATIELDNGKLVDVPLVLVDSPDDVHDMMVELKKNHESSLAGIGEVSVPPKRLRKKVGWPKGKKRGPRKKKMK